MNSPNDIKMNIDQDFTEREQEIHNRIKSLYGKKLGRSISDAETKEIAGNLLSFAKVIYGT